MNEFQDTQLVNSTLREKCRYSELFWSAFSRIRTAFPALSLRDNADQNSSEYEHFLHSVKAPKNHIPVT